MKCKLGKESTNRLGQCGKKAITLISFESSRYRGVKWEKVPCCEEHMQIQKNNHYIQNVCFDQIKKERK